MDTPALRKAISKEGTKGKKAFTIPKRTKLTVGELRDKLVSNGYSRSVVQKMRKADLEKLPRKRRTKKEIAEAKAMGMEDTRSQSKPRRKRRTKAEMAEARGPPPTPMKDLKLGQWYDMTKNGKFMGSFKRLKRTPDGRLMWGRQNVTDTGYNAQIIDRSRDDRPVKFSTTSGIEYVVHDREDRQKTHPKKLDMSGVKFFKSKAEGIGGGGVGWPYIKDHPHTQAYNKYRNRRNKGKRDPRFSTIFDFYL